MPMRAASAIFSRDQMPPPSPILLVIQVMSIPKVFRLPCAGLISPAPCCLDARTLVWRCSATRNLSAALRSRLIFILRDDGGDDFPRKLSMFSLSGPKIESRFADQQLRAVGSRANHKA